MARSGKKLLRSIQIQFPMLLEAKFAGMRMYRNTLRRPFEHDFRALALFPDDEDALFLDVGANRGQSTDAIRMHRPNARVELFEPNTLLCGKLQRMFAADSRIMVHDLGLGDEEVEAVLIIPVYKRWMFDGLGSFNQQEAAEWLRGRMYFYDEHRLTLQQVQSRIVRLDGLNLRPFFIKLDIQGYEFKALQGGEQTLRKHEPVLLIESPEDRTIAYLAGLGYEFYAFQGKRFVQRTVGAPNTFFMTKPKAELVRAHIDAREGPIIRL
jgi:FkbM family methyltransferase